MITHPDMSETLAKMNENRYKINQSNNPIAVERFPELTREIAPVILGSFSRTNVIKHWKLVIDRHAHNLGAGIVSPADIARDYLSVKFPKWRPRACTSQYKSTIANKISQPMHYIKCSGDGVYLDMRSAYWQIIQRSGWNVDYSRGRFVLGGADVRDFPAPHIKLARNSLVSVGMGGSMQIWDGEKIISNNQSKKFTNVLLFSFVMDILNTIAYEMVQAGAVYVNTDGYILPYSSLDRAYEIADSWGVEMIVKDQGHYHVKGFGAYDIDGRRAGIGRISQSPERTIIHPQNPEWLKKKFLYLAETRGLSK